MPMAETEGTGSGTVTEASVVVSVTEGLLGAASFVWLTLLRLAHLFAWLTQIGFTR